MKSPLILSVVVPCYNEEQNILHLHQRLSAVLEEYRVKGIEIILVNDGSQDNTWEMIQQVCAQDDSVIGIHLSRNFGHQMALSCGLDHSRAQRVLIIDADLQDPPELLAEMMGKMDEGYEVVYGHRRFREGENPLKKISAWLYYRVLNRLSEVKIPLDTGDFRLMDRKVVQALNALPERVRLTRGLISWLGFRQTAVDYTRHARHAGKTHYKWQAMFSLAIEGITSFSTRPLQIATWLGCVMTLISMLLLLYVFFSWLFFNTVRGWASLAAIFLLFQSAQWIFFGIIGNYLAIMFREIKARPLYIVDTIIGRDS